MPRRFELPGGLPFGFARFLSWVSLVLILATSIVMSVVITDSARNTMFRKQQEFASLLAENLNHQIYRRFTLPTLVGFGRIALRQPVQYERLDQLVQSVVHGLQVSRVRIYDHGKVVSYSTDRADLGRTDLAGPEVAVALRDEDPSYTVDASISFWQALFTPRLEPGSFILRTTYPLRVENRLGRIDDDDDGPIMGVLEMTQDITNDTRSIIAFQWLIIGTASLSSLVLFGMLLVFIRRAERVMAERMQEKQRLEHELHQHEKLAGMGRVVASIAHEIRNPLGIIRSSAELLLKRPSSSDPVTARILQAIYDEAKRLSQTVNDFLDYARPRQPRQDPVETDAVLDRVLGFLEGELTRREVTVAREAEPGITVSGDGDLLYRAFYNIMVNALQAMDGPGSITVTSRRDGDAVELAFRDSGPGFDPANRERLLDPFFTTKDDGTGLGLPIVNSIVTSHGGSLRIDNAPEGGAVVYVRLPLRAE